MRQYLWTEALFQRAYIQFASADRCLPMGISTPMLGVRAASYSRLVFSRIVKSGLLLAEGVISVAYVVPEAWDS